MKKALTSCSLILSISLCCQTGLSASYLFSGNATDLTGNGNNGTVYGASLSVDRFGNSNSAYHFNGTSDYIDLGSNLSYNSHSISCWVKLDSVPSSNFFVFLSGLNDQSMSNTNNELRVYMTGKPEYILGTGSGYGAIQNSTNLVYFDTIDWHHIVVTYDSSAGKAIMYWDNQAIDSTTTGFYQTNNSATFLGARPYWTGAGGTTFFIGGSLDDINIFDHAIPPGTVDSLYLDGGFSTEIASENDASIISVYPNPCVGPLNISCSVPYKSITIRDISGRVLLIQSANSGSPIDISSLQPGTYFITTDNPEIPTRKILKV